MSDSVWLLDEFDPSAILTDITRQEAELATADHRMTSTAVTAGSSDGLVEATVTATGSLRAIRLAPETFRRSNPDTLAASVVEAARQAALQVLPSRRLAMAPIDAVRTQLTDLAQAQPGPPQPIGSYRPDRVVVTAADGSVRVTVDPMGIVVAVDISAAAFRSSNGNRLAAAITATAQRAARTQFDARLGAWETASDSAEQSAATFDVDALYPLTTPTPDFDEPVARPTLEAPTPAENPHLIAGTRKPNRNQVYIPHDIAPDTDDDDPYQPQRRSWLA